MNKEKRQENTEINHSEETKTTKESKEKHRILEGDLPALSRRRTFQDGVIGADTYCSLKIKNMKHFHCTYAHRKYI